jgi:imidazolonepropionase-like amidohydrolase
MIPGLWDMHTHLALGGEELLGLLVANGVTGVRDMGGDFSLIKTYRARITAGSLLGPRIKAAGQIVEDANWVKKMQSVPIPEIQALMKADPRLGIATPEEARQAVNKLADAGVDTVKIRSAPSLEAYLALADEAKKRGLALVGHLPPRIGLMEASDAGQKSIEHASSLAFSKDLDKLSAVQKDELYSRLTSNKTWFTPTLVAEQYQGATEAFVSPLIEGETGVHAERHRFVPTKLLDFWRLQKGMIKFNPPGLDLAALVSKGTERLREMHRAKVPMLAGTDLGIMLVYPGLAVHDELELLVSRVGMTAAEALRTATLNPAIFLEMEDKTGTIKAGKMADLVLLDANPLQNIGNTRSINAVVVNGRYLSKKDLSFAAR